jgi:diadenylate cyclase
VTPFVFPEISFGLADVVDILATATLACRESTARGSTRAVPILFGILVLVLVLAAANLFHLLVLATVLQYVLLGTALTLPIVFQPELRRFLEQLGRGGMLARREAAAEAASLEDSVASLARAAVVLSRSRVGALIAIEGATGLREFVESGTRLDARLSVELLLTLFTPNSPLHDGAVIVRGNLVEAAGCFLPLSDNVFTDSHLGTRHRAAIGLTEQTDAVALIISEQTGTISLARLGKLSRELDDETRLRSVLLACCRAARGGRPQRPPRRRAGFGRRVVRPESGSGELANPRA